ncbi:tetratricopeptide repeat protein [Qipengyuania sp. ASV99]|uniref:tetratricopeptide repeat protein n=1 Tax=Qipengyuania sp. ASV99 TaxID=3399681 RepID=UPI003A4C5757
MARTPTQPPAGQEPRDDAPGAPSREDEILMREIDEAVRQEDTTQFLRKYGAVLGGGFALLIAAMLGYWYWDSSTETGLERQSEAIIGALDSVDAGDFAGADEKVAPLVEDGSPGARTVARFLQAASALEQGEQARAVELYAAIAADPEAPQPMRDLALIREISTNFDDREPADVIARLERLAVPGNAFFGSAGELVAIAHLEAGNRDEAGALFAEISKDEEIPETLRSRARQMAGLLGVDAIEDVEKLLEEEGVLPVGGAAPAGAAQ